MQVGRYSSDVNQESCWSVRTILLAILQIVQLSECTLSLCMSCVCVQMLVELWGVVIGWHA